MSEDLEIRIAGDRVSVYQQGEESPLAIPVKSLIEQVRRSGSLFSNIDVIPRGTVLIRERLDATAVAVEIPPLCRTVRWITDDSAAAFGKEAKYRNVHLSFPYIVLLLVFRAGGQSGLQQLFYRTEPMSAGDELLLSNLPNVAKAYGQTAWLCTQHLKTVSKLCWPDKIDSIVDHVFSASFNRSAEEHEGNSYWSSAHSVDPRVATLEDWEKASRDDPRFALDVAWRPAGLHAAAELERMLDCVIEPAAPADVAELTSLILGARARRRRRR